MRRADREAKVRELGRFAYRLLCTQDESCIVTVDGEDKRLREFKSGWLVVTMYEVLRPQALPTERSRILIRYAGRKVLDIRWNAGPPLRDGRVRAA